MAYRIEFEIAGLPLPVNAQTSMHWRRKGEHVRMWHALVGAAVGARKPPKPLSVARLTLVRYSATEPDFDGLVSSFKPVIDGLIRCGVIEDDKARNIGQSSYSWEKAKPKQGRVRVLVEECPAVEQKQGTVLADGRTGPRVGTPG